ncbi:MULTISPECIES: phage holin, lambda family [Serratia]|uniref:phage holin, lambda family n=1 Tax=Serratia TaxID=613 RepID=UPI001CBD9254|nr:MULTISPECIES: phage holin, lambda family [Serratia]
MKMKDNPDLWPGIVNALKALWPALGGSAIACAVCYARIIHDGERRKNKWVEGILCGLLAFSVSNGLVYLGMPDGSDVFAGAMIGFIGVEKLREYALRFISKKTGNGE